METAIVWDPPKRAANMDKHGLDFATLTLAFFRAGVILPARSGRLKAIGRLAGDVVVVIFAPLGTEAISVISMRTASPTERRLFHDQT